MYLMPRVATLFTLVCVLHTVAWIAVPHVHIEHGWHPLHASDT